MGILDEFKQTFGEDALTGTTANIESRHNWAELCVCGHLDRHHSPNIGGTYRVRETQQLHAAGIEYTRSYFFHGCVGALKTRDFEEETVTNDREAGIQVITINPTCPCTEFRPIVRVDRPNRYFNQQLPRDRADLSRHPFMVGIRAFHTHLSRRKPAQTDPTWPEKEFDRRFTWLPDARVCAISACKKTDDVWPTFVDRADRSELRCDGHRG